MEEPEPEPEEMLIPEIKMEIDECPRVHLVNIDTILGESQTTSFTEDSNYGIRVKQEHEPEDTCSGCTKRDITIAKLLDRIQILEKQMEQKTKTVQYWKNVSIDLKRSESSLKQSLPKPKLFPIISSNQPAKLPKLRKVRIIRTGAAPAPAPPTPLPPNIKPYIPPKNVPINVVKNLYKCSSCSKSYATATELRNHVRDQHHDTNTPNAHGCSFCEMKFGDQKLLELHLKTHISYAKCEICTKEGPRDEHLCIREESIACEYCAKRFRSTKPLLAHLERFHFDRKTYKCGQCAEYFGMEILKNIHENNNHQSVRNTFYGIQLNPGETFLCDTCGKECNSKDKLRTHLRVHQEPTVKCPDCPQLFKNKFDLRRHADVHNDEKFICSICGSALSTTGSLRTHMMDYHSGKESEKVTCEICSKQLKSRKYLKRHMKTHTNQRDFQCEYCKQWYKYKPDLTKHLRTHLGDNIYSCDQCPDKFRLKSELQKHSFKHYKEQKNSLNEQS